MMITSLRQSVARLLAATLFLTAPIGALAIEWPQEITADEGTIVVYQPQPENLQGNVLSGRAAMSLEIKDSDEPIFGAFWFDARIDTDTDNNTAFIRDMRVTKVRWPDSNDASEQRFTAIVDAAIPASGFEISLERLSASLEAADMERKSLANLKNDPPQIIFREQLAVLLLFDGEAKFSPIENSDYERALNTPFVVVRKKRGNDYFLSSGTFWYAAADAMGPWTPTTSPPPDLVKMLPKPETDDAVPGSPPAIVTADKPTELIATQGKPDWQSLPGGKVLYVQNTESPWLRDASTNNMYLLLSGRWFRSKSQGGPWVFVPSTELPESFKDIPPESDIGGLRTSVAGTEEAEDAVMDAQIPQTAAIKRSEASLAVEYDGAPKFEKIPGTGVSYAVNTGAQVLEIEKRYYAVDNGVWFTAASATGPWVVADSIPSEEIQKIPPSSPVYNTTHVHIYESTPEVVYVGYTPGYMWSFPYYGVPVYGTGWHYPPYYGHFYYPRPPTWGFNIGYNPWTGWNFGLSWSNGFFSFGIAWGGGYPGMYRPWGCCNGWYGGGHRGPTFINTGDINIGNNVSIGNRTTVRNRMDRSNNVDINNARNNLYNRPENSNRVADRATASANLRQARPAGNRDNNVFADSNGNVARKVGDGWEGRQNGQWTKDSIRPAARDQIGSSVQQRATPSAGQRMPSTAQYGNFDSASMNRASMARQHGASREMARPSHMRRPAGRRR